MNHYSLKNAPGCLTRSQKEGLLNLLMGSCDEPSLLCDLEGCGPVMKLEKEFAKLCQTRFALALSSGTAAIHTALLACGIGPGDEVVVTPYSWPQSVSPVIFAGATPVFADIDPQRLNLDPGAVCDLISSKTKAILPVHLFGHPADMLVLQKIATDAGAYLIADAAHAIGADIGGHSVAKWGDVACFSLTRGKLVSGGEGGLLVTDDEDIYEKAVVLTQHPARSQRMWGRNYSGNLIGLNYRLHPLAAFLALEDLKSMNKRLLHRKKVLKNFQIGLGDQDVISMPASLIEEEAAAYGIPLIFNKTIGREELCRCMQKKEVPLRCGPVTSPLHLRLRSQLAPLNTFHISQNKGACPAAEDQCRNKEIWALSALDMDGITAGKAYRMGVKVSKEVMRSA